MFPFESGGKKGLFYKQNKVIGSLYIFGLKKNICKLLVHSVPILLKEIRESFPQLTPLNCHKSTFSTCFSISSGFPSKCMWVKTTKKKHVTSACMSPESVSEIVWQWLFYFRTVILRCCTVHVPLLASELTNYWQKNHWIKALINLLVVHTACLNVLLNPSTVNVFFFSL